MLGRHPIVFLVRLRHERWCPLWNLVPVSARCAPSGSYLRSSLLNSCMFPGRRSQNGKAALPCPARPICLPYANYSACRPSSLLRRRLCSSQCIGAVRPHLCCSPWRSSCFSQGRRCFGGKASCRTASSAMPMPRPGCTLPVLPPCRFCCSAQERCWRRVAQRSCYGQSDKRRANNPLSHLAQNRKKEQMLLHLLFLNLILAVSFLLRARSLRLLATLDARAFIMLTLAELGKRTRLGARTLKTAQRAVNRLVFLNADLRHSFPSLRAFPYGGTLCTASCTSGTKNRKNIISVFTVCVNNKVHRSQIVQILQQGHQQHDHAQRDTVPAEHLEVVLAYVAHQELDDHDRGQKCDQRTGAQHQQFRPGK